MSEASLRKFHRKNGIILFWFLFIQGFTGLILSLGDLAGAEAAWWFKSTAFIHHEWNPLGSIYRIGLALFAFSQGLSGILIYSLIRSRTKRA